MRIPLSATGLLIVVLVAPTTSLGAESPADSGTVSAGEVGQQAREFGEALAGYTAAQRDAALKKAGQALDSLDARVDRLEARIRDHWSTMSDAARKEAQAKLNELRARRAEAADGYQRLEHSSAAAWEHVKEGFAESYEALQKAWREAAGEFAADH